MVDIKRLLFLVKIHIIRDNTYDRDYEDINKTRKWWWYARKRLW